MDPVLKTRSMTAFFFAIAVITLIFLGRNGGLLFLSIVAIGSSYEFCKIVTNQSMKSYFASGISLVLILLVYFSDFSTSLVSNFAALISLVQIYMVYAMYTNSKVGYENSMPYFTMLYPTLSILVLFHFFLKIENYDALLLFAIIALIWVSDSGAYLVGRKIGKTKLFERISPKKTWEGTIGAGIFTIFFALIFFFLRRDYGLVFWFTAAITIWITGTYGDLVESSIKRKYGVKDSGTLLPGHGGFFDRFDSFIFVAPIIYIILIIFKIVL